jgi:alanine racemase
MGVMSQTYSTIAEIDTDAFAHNICAVRARLSPSCQLMAVVKANAYGHGAVPLAFVALQAGATWLAVARGHEGVTLRQQGIKAPILVLGPVWAEDVSTLVTYQLTAVVGTPDDAERLHSEAQRQEQFYRIHTKIDTGMGRLGLTPEMIPTFLEKLHKWSSLRLEGLMTHLATADETDERTVKIQLQKFHQVVRACAAQGIAPRYIHAANSAALYRYPVSHGTMVRPGIALYGSHPFEAPDAGALRPVLTWKSRIVRVQTMPPESGISYGHTFVTRRRSCVGTLPVGYADGLNRRLSNVGEVLIHGKRAPIVGQITMDMCLIDLTDIPQASIGDEVVLIGSQDTDRITVEEIAASCGQIPYEVFCAISHRVPRRYVSNIPATPLCLAL